MFQDKDAETEMPAKHVKRIVHCFLEPNDDEAITGLEAMRISVDKKSIA